MNVVVVDVKDLTAQLKLTSMTSGFTIDLGDGPSATAKQVHSIISSNALG